MGTQTERPDVVRIVRDCLPTRPTENRTRPRTWWCQLVAVFSLAAAATVGCSQRPEFVKYVPTVDVVPRLSDTTKVQLGGWVPYVYSDCGVVNFKYVPAKVNPDSSGWKGVLQHDRQAKEKPARDVAFATMRFPDREAFDEQWKTLEIWFSQPCLSADDGITTVEPLSIDGLPENSLSARWPGRTSTLGLSTIVADPDRLTMMFVVWVEGPQPISTADYADVVNDAWTEFQTNN